MPWPEDHPDFIAAAKAVLDDAAAKPKKEKGRVVFRRRHPGDAYAVASYETAREEQLRDENEARVQAVRMREILRAANLDARLRKRKR